MRARGIDIVRLTKNFMTRIGWCVLGKTKRLNEKQICSHALLRVMRDWSEDNHSSGWHDNLEVEIWKLVLAGRENAPNTNLYDSAMFDYLATKACGWWVWDDGTDGNGHPVFVPIKTWLTMFAEICKLELDYNGITGTTKKIGAL